MSDDDLEVVEEALSSQIPAHKKPAAAKAVTKKKRRKARPVRSQLARERIKQKQRQATAQERKLASDTEPLPLPTTKLKRELFNKGNLLKMLGQLAELLAGNWEKRSMLAW